MTDGTDPGSGSGFPDPTAPPWGSAEPTQPIPGTEPAAATSPDAVPPTAPLAVDPWAGGSPGPAQYPPPSYPPPGTDYGQPAPSPYEQMPYGQARYGQAPYGQAPYGQAPYGQAPYGQTPYGQAPYGYSPYEAQPRSNGGALVLTIVAAVATAMCCLLFTPSLVLGIVALSKQSTDPAASARLTRYGWVAAGICVVLGILAVVLFIAFGTFSSIGGSSSYQFDGT